MSKTADDNPRTVPDEAGLTEPADARHADDARPMSRDKVERIVLRNEQLREKMMRIGEHRDYLRGELDRTLAEYETQRRSYYLSNYREKIDISELPAFGDAAKTVIAEGRTGMSFDRLYTLWQGVMRAPDALPLIEVGSYKGGSAKLIAEALRCAGRSPRFYVCDTFAGHARLDPVIDGVESDQGFKDTSAESVREYLTGYPNVEVVAGDIIDIGAQLSEPLYGFVHVDVDVYPPTAFCLDYFSKRLAPGAWMVVDDYGVITCPGAQKAVDDFARDNPAFSKLHLLTAQALVFRAG
jgi:hypothetical protein